MSYLANLTRRLAAGLDGAEPDFRLRHAEYLSARQNPDGGFSGRGGGSDLYYTGFGLRGLAALRALNSDVAGKAAGFLRGRLTRDAAIIDFVSLLYSAALISEHGGPDVLAEARADWGQVVADAFEVHRSPDGGYAKTAQNTAGSTYHTFLVGLCAELAGRPIPEPAKAVRFLLSRRRDDGGFVEIGPMKRGGTNPTAAAIGMLALLAPGEDVMPEPVGRAVTDGVVGFLSGVQSPAEGGFRANRVAPVADLLSTFTAMLTLIDLQAGSRIDAAGAERFVRGCEQPEGGFRAGFWDDAADVEYTFYGLGAVALLRGLENA